MKKILIFVIPISFILAACTAEPVQTADAGGHITALDQSTYDWGKINIEGGVVKKGFHFRNDGNEDLILSKAVTSCMCTSAYFELPDGSISPKFGMHGGSNINYAVKPGEEFELEVEFDPMAHGPQGVGQIKRSISVESSSAQGDVEVEVTADVLSKEDYQAQFQNDIFEFEETEFDFGEIRQSGGIVSHDFNFLYNGPDPITITGVPTSCQCTSAEISGEKLEAGDFGTLTVSFDPNLHEEPEGKFFKTITVMTEPALEKQPEVKIWAQIDLDLGPESYKLKEEHKD